MSQSPIMLMVIPILAASVPVLLLQQPLGWSQTAASLGAIGLCFAAWVDVLDNCAHCAEHDSLLLSGAWALSSGLVAIGFLMLLVRRLAQRYDGARDSP